VPASITIVGRPYHRALTGFLTELRRAFAQQSRAVCVDFSATQKLFPEGMLLLYSELDRLRTLFPAKEVRCIPSPNKTVDGVLQHLGVYAMVNHLSESAPEGDDVVGWKVHYGMDVNGDVFGPPIEALGLKTEHTSGLFKGVSEAVTNVRHHAHLAERKDGLQLPGPRKWWMFIHESEQRLYVAVCDLGIGIPRSLPLWHGPEAVAHALRVMFGRRRYNDGMRIKAALRLRRSRTDAGNRGKGFSDIIAALNTMPESRMTIFSNHGALRYNPSDRLPAIKVRTFENSILGTIIAWQFPARGKDHGH
jgi:hypothetical protein